MVTIGTLTSHPDINGKHSLKCPKCSTVFLSTIKKGNSGNLMNITCPKCGTKDDPKPFIYAVQKESVDEMALNAADKMIRELLHDRNINIKLEL